VFHSGQSTLLPGRLSAIEHSNTRPATQSPIRVAAAQQAARREAR
jgi:hypothetical protein